MVMIFPKYLEKSDPPSRPGEHFHVKTEGGIELRSSFSVKSFPGVLSLLAQDLTTLLNFWSSVPKFVEEDITRAAVALKDEVEVQFALL